MDKTTAEELRRAGAAEGARLNLEGIAKRFDGGSVAVSALDLEALPGEFVVLVGPSGCGKSTTLRMVAGLEAPTEGRIRIDGRDVTALGAADRDVAMVFQDYALYPHMSVARNMGFGLRRRGASREETRRAVAEAARILELDDLLDRRPGELSGGQRQRVAMGRAIVRRPRLFLFDEPLSNLDARLRISMRTEVKRLHARFPTTTLYVTHDQTEAMTMADRVVVMNAGRVEQVGTPMEVYDRPASLFVAGFVGSPPMNLFPARLEAGALHAEGRRILPDVPAGLPDGPVMAGLRPEALRLADPGAQGAMPARLDLLEPLGAETLALWTAEGLGEVWVRHDARARLAPGLRAALTAHAADLHLFDPGTGTALRSGAFENRSAPLGSPS
ncbi:ABC transporter ATP-binding protein [Histidinibacterium lentulum]|uniref:sn-glycerol-3-phosphate ABC transporter ATP-binding protein UgpC n=1 Tax=Histidinibacterium lentulum TaxID=2480588 RepID=A0A3N2QSB2_9RHOB|nr:sn-glycerol-3-phosphate ABC transporter ATP-binding protein UgpC [Histidinibacterium lentulum]ROT98097.1 sn-glycerol-3-phosphate ABC transporter ATP-binding protein UgpC [Histidinibacterium lentulum]